MQSIVGIVDTQDRARRIARDVLAAVPRAQLRILTPETKARDLAAFPTDDAEQPGMGGAIGAVAGGAAAAGVASVVVPPAGAIAIVGLAVAALVGGLGGRAAGRAIEESAAFGLPRDELLFYVHALSEGRFVVVATVEDDHEAERVRDVFGSADVQDVDAAREAWWIGLRDAEAAVYGGGFEAAEGPYRRGFEAACRGWHLEAVGAAPQERGAAEAGYARGLAYVEATRRRHAADESPAGPSARARAKA